MRFPLSAEIDDAFNALVTARHRIQEAIDETTNLGGPQSLVDEYERFNSDVSGLIERLDASRRLHRTAVDVEQVEERHVDAQIMPWMENDDAW